LALIAYAYGLFSLSALITSAVLTSSGRRLDSEPPFFPVFVVHDLFSVLTGITVLTKKGNL
jgi:hypothetical protein